MLRMSPCFTLRLTTLGAGRSSWEDVVRFFQFEFELGHDSAIPLCFHLHGRVQAFCPEATKIGKELV